MHKKNCSCQLEIVKNYLETKKYLLAFTILEKNLISYKISSSCQKTSFFLLNRFLQKLFFSRTLSKPLVKLFFNFFSLERIKKWLTDVNFNFFHPLIFMHLRVNDCSVLKNLLNIYLQDTQFSALNKTLLLLALKKHSSDQEFLLTKNGSTAVVIPKNLPNWEKLSITLKIYKFVDYELMAENLSVAKVAKIVTNKFLLFFYPWIPFTEQFEALLATIIFQSFQVLNIKKTLQELAISFDTSFAALKTVLIYWKQKGFLQFLNQDANNFF